MGFREDINGLRTWAVVSVVLFHFGVPGFSGGFAGVDVFFVISGFLMTGIIASGLERNQFSIWKFYLARCRRIIPALFVLCAVLLIFGWFFLIPQDYRMLGGHAASSVGFLSNMKYWQEAGYFDAASEDKWLLHTWSLSVEWQFYMLLPVLLVIAWKLRPRRSTLLGVVSIGAIASLCLSIWLTPKDPSTAFYLFPTRAWEMLAGGLVYFGSDRKAISDHISRVLELLGFALIVFTILAFGTGTDWPGWKALVPVAGSAGILLARRPSSLFTSSFIFQWIGTRSYSIYLWHWPAAVFLMQSELIDSWPAVTAGVAFSILMGHLSYVWVESGVRNIKPSYRIFSGFPAIASSVVLVGIIGSAIFLYDGLPQRLSTDARTVAREAENRNPNNKKCLLKEGVKSPECLIGGEKLSAVMLGDSHAAAITTALLSAAPSPDAGIRQLTYSSCPIIEGVMKQDRPECAAYVEWAIEEMKNLPPEVPLVIVNRHAQFAFGANEKRNSRPVPEVYFSKPYEVATPEFLEEYSTKFVDTVCRFAEPRQVYLVRPIPELGKNVPASMVRAMMRGEQVNVSISLEEYYERQNFILTALDTAQEKCNAIVLDPLPYLCSDGRCYGARDNFPLYSDDDHLSESGNKILVPMFARVFAQDVHVQRDDM